MITEKFEYPDINTISYNNQRWYNVKPEVYYPSITTVLGNTMSIEKKKTLDNWKDALGALEAERRSKYATDRGSNVHLLLEYHLKGLPPPPHSATKEDIGVFNSIKLKLKNITEIWGQECALYSDIIGVAGRCDLAGKWKDRNSIIDFKTSGRFKTEKEIEDYWIQIAFYATAHNEMFKTDINYGVILMGVEGGIPMVFEREISDESILMLINKTNQFYSMNHENI